MPSVSRFLRRFSTKDGPRQSSEYVEFDTIFDNVANEDSTQQRLNSIWRNDSRNTDHRDIVEHVQQQEYTSPMNKIDRNSHKHAHSHGARSMPVIMHEHIVNTTNQFNKVFASTFLSEDIVTFGTKDNKLMMLDVVKGKICQIRLPNPEKSFDYNRRTDGVAKNNNDPNATCGIHDLKFNLNNNLLVTGGHQPQDVAVFKYDNDIHHVGPRKFSHNLVPMANLKFHKDWIFAMDFIDDNHVVAGGRDGQLSIWDLSNIDQTYRTFREKHGFHNYDNQRNSSIKSNDANSDNAFPSSFPELQQRLLDDTSGADDDWVAFNSDGALLDNNHVQQLKSKQKTASQDRCNVPILRKPVHFTTNKQHRIRALKTFSKSSMAHSQCVVTLATTGEVQIFDVSQSKTLLNEMLPHRKETVCVEINQDKGQIIVGSQSHIQIFDPRCSLDESMIIIDSLDKNWGCRTISCYTDLLTIGGGLGRLSFYDLRANRYLDCSSKSKTKKEAIKNKPVSHRTIDKGWIKKDDVYNNIFSLHGLPTPTAVYTHCYNPQRAKLFVAGGPTPYGLFGSAASVYF